MTPIALMPLATFATLASTRTVAGAADPLSPRSDGTAKKAIVTSTTKVTTRTLTNRAAAMPSNGDSLIAIDVLLEPDQTMITKARGGQRPVAREPPGRV